jgi:hypothetical protein
MEYALAPETTEVAYPRGMGTPPAGSWEQRAEWLAERIRAAGRRIFRGPDGVESTTMPETPTRAAPETVSGARARELILRKAGTLAGAEAHRRIPPEAGPFG